uniref:C2 domain-containing protein n=1 Tax=Tetraodon nigroviridis TaxID=99883 RepID=H3C4U0_TETNG
MSLVGQSQTWFPTSVQVTVHQARGLRVKGRNGTNDTYAIIQVAKEKFSTSVAEKSVSPVWKEGASFDLPLFHSSNAKRCTLYISVMHQSHVGLDKFLGQAVVNLLEVFDNKSCKKNKEIKCNQTVPLHINETLKFLIFLVYLKIPQIAIAAQIEHNWPAHSFSSKLKEKVSRRKKNGLSDSASAIVSSSSHVLTDSEGEVDTQSLKQSSGVKKQSKLKTFFAPKSNLQRNISQSLSTIRTFADKNLSPSGSCSSGLDGESLKDENAFKFLGHEQTPRFDSRISQGPVTLLDGFKQSNSELKNLYNSSHLYKEEIKTGSNVNLKSIGQGSLDDALKHTSDTDSVSCIASDRDILEQQCHIWQEDKRQEIKHAAQAKFLEEEQKYRQEGKRLKEEEECRSHEELEKNRSTSKNKKMLELAENQKLEKECCSEEEQKQQE